ncbi:MAG: O-antigen ligase family protein [Planctomycetes bacterium]|nr:O-antigen ligase family protein [Planctomycetota bacterium]
MSRKKRVAAEGASPSERAESEPAAPAPSAATADGEDTGNLLEPGLSLLALALVSAQVCARVMLNSDSVGFGANLCLSLLLWIPVLLIGFAGPLLGGRFRRSLPRGAATAAALAFACLSAASPLHASSGYAAVSLAVPWVTQVALFFLIASLGHAPRRARLVLVALLSTATALAGLGLHQYFVGFAALREAVAADARLVSVAQPLLYEFYARLMTDQPFSTFLTSNSLAGFLCMVFPILLGWMVDGLRGRERVGFGRFVLSVIPLLVVGGALGLTQSKGGILATGVGLGVLLLVGGWGGMTWARRGTLLAVALAGLALPSLQACGVGRAAASACGAAVAALAGGIAWRSGGRAERPLVAAAAAAGAANLALLAAGLFDPLDLKRAASSMGFRAGYWFGAWEIFRRNWLVGIGLDGFADQYVTYKSAVAGETQRAHNDYLQIAAELGIGGFLAYVTFWGALLGGGIRGLWREGGGAAAAAGVAGAATAEADGSRAVSEREESFLAVGGGFAAVCLVALLTGCFNVGTGEWLFFGLLALWGVTAVALGLGRLPADTRGLRCGLVAGLSAYVVHSLVDLDAYVLQVSWTAWLAAGALVALDRSGETSRRVDCAVSPAARRRLGVGLLVAALAYVGLAIPWASRLVSADALMGQARDSEEKGDPFSAAGALERARELSPSNPAIRQELARAYHAQCLSVAGPEASPERLGPIFRACRTAAEGAIALAPENAGLHYTRGSFLHDHAGVLEGQAAAGQELDRAQFGRMRDEAFKGAFESCREAARLYPTRAEYRFRYGVLLESWAHSPAAARREFADALYLSEINPLGRLRLSTDEQAYARSRVLGR